MRDFRLQVMDKRNRREKPMPEPVSVLDVAAYILDKRGKMSTWKLQKLCYYAQAWSLVWDEEPLFEENIEAWANGPVVPRLYREHQGQFYVSTMKKGDSSKLNGDQLETIDVVLEAYGKKTGSQLRTLTHRELPWRETRRGARLTIGERGSAVISHNSMYEYYSGLLDAEEPE